MDKIVIDDPFDAHVHFREGERMRAVVGYTARQCTYATVMPNTNPFILTTDDAKRYRDEILAATPSGIDFRPLMTLYLTPQLSPDEIRKAKASGIVHGIKLYPKGGTTGSHGGVENLPDVEEQLRVMEDVGMKLFMHGETADQDMDVFEREVDYYDQAFEWITTNFSKLQIVCEHITTWQAVARVEEAPAHLQIAATITPQHLLVNRNDMLGRGGIRPHMYCMPILKTLEDQTALLNAAVSDNPRFFLGTDSAPHAEHGDAGKAKETSCGCAGCFTAHAALELYAQAFDGVGKIDRLSDFAGRFGREFYELSPVGRSVTMQREEWSAPESYNFGDACVVPFMQDVPLTWKMVA
jgi:dihydroorotase